MQLLKRMLGVVSVTLLLICAGSAWASSCDCPPHYCTSAAKAQQLKNAKKAQMRRAGYPERLINMVDELPDCDYCINTAPDGFNIRITYNNGNSMAMGWSRHNEYLARKDLASGKIKKFEIVYTAKPCHCCPKEEYDGSLPPGGGTGIGKTFDNPKALGVMPPDLTQTTGGKGTQAVPPPPKQERPKPPRIAQALCPACKDLVDQYNALMQQIYETELKIYNANKNVHILYHALQLDLDRINQLSQLAHTPEVAEKIAKAESIYQAHVADYQRELAKLEALQDQLKVLKDQVAALDKKIAECEKTQCHYTPPVAREPIKPHPQPEQPKPEQPKAPSLHQLFDLGVNVSWDSVDQSAAVDAPAERYTQPAVSRDGVGVGLDLTYKLHGSFPIFLYAEVSRPNTADTRLFDALTDPDAVGESHVSTKPRWQALFGAGVNVWHAHHVTVGLAALLGATYQTVTSRIAENAYTYASRSQWLFTPGAMVQAAVPLCHACFVHRPLTLTGRFMWLHIPSESVTSTTVNNNTYTSTANSSSEYRGELAISTPL